MDKKLQDIVQLEADGYRATAVRRLREYVREFPGDAEAWYYLARFAPQPKTQKAAIDRAVALEPDYKDAIEFQAVLLEEYPELENTGGNRRLVLMMGGAILVLAVIGFSIALLPSLLDNAEPETVIIVPSPEPTDPTAIPPTVDIPTPTMITTFTETPIPATEAANIATPAPIVSVTPTQSLSSFSDSRQRIIIAGEDADILSANLVTMFGEQSLFFEVTDQPITTEPDAVALLDSENATMVIFVTDSDDEQLTVQLYSENTDDRARNDPNLVWLARIPTPWGLTVTLNRAEIAQGRGLSRLIAPVGYVGNAPQMVITALDGVFDSPSGILTPDETLLASMLGYAFQTQGNADDALDIYDVLNTYSNDPAPYILVNRAYAIAQNGDVESALATYERLYAEYSDQVFIQTLIGRMYTLNNNVESARLAYEEAIALNSSAAFPYLARGVLWSEQGDATRALEDFGSAINRERTYALAYYERAALRLDLGLSDDALADVDLAIELQPEIGVYHQLKGEILLQQTDWEAATTALEQALSLGATRATTHAALAQAYYELGNLDGTRRESDNALQLDPTLSTAWLYNGLAYLAQGNIQSAISAFDQGIDANDQDADLYVARCAAHARSGDDGLAALDCDNALLVDPVNGYALEQRGLIRYRAEDRAGAAEDFAEAITYAPDAYEALYHLGFFAAQEQRLEVAIDFFTRALEIAPFLGKAYKERGIVYRVTNNWELAIADIDRAIGLLPDDFYLYYELGLAKRALADRAAESGNTAQAILLYEEAADGFRTFLNAQQPGDPFVDDATAGLLYANDALNVLQGGQ